MSPHRVGESIKEILLKKRQVALLSLLALAAALTVGCGSDSSTPMFTKLPFSSDRESSPATPIFLMNLDGSHVTPVVYSGDSFFSPSISADLKTIAFISGTDVWAMKSDGTGSKQLTTVSDSSFIFAARISPNGKKILFSVADNATETIDLRIMNVDGSGQKSLLATLPTGIDEGCYTGSFSSDSRTVTFACYETSVGYGLYSADAAGTNLKTVTAPQGDFIDTPTFSPDGKKILFVSFNFGCDCADKSKFASRHKWTFGLRAQGAKSAGGISQEGVFSVNLDGSGAVLVAANAFEAEILNSTLYYTVWDQDAELEQIWKSNVDGSSAVKISDGTANDRLELQIFD